MLYVEHSTWFTQLLYVELAINAIIDVSIYQMCFMLLHRSEARMPIDFAFGTYGDISLQKLAYKVTKLVKQACEMMSKVQNA